MSDGAQSAVLERVVDKELVVVEEGLGIQLMKGTVTGGAVFQEI